MAIDFFNHFIQLGKVVRHVGSFDINQFPVYFYFAVVNKRITQDLLNCNNFSLPGFYLVAEAKLFCVDHKVYFEVKYTNECMVFQGNRLR